MALSFTKRFPVEAVDQVQEMQRLILKHDFATYAHCQKVAHWSVLIGSIMGLSKSDTLCLYYGALIHDVGKIAVPKEILNKPGSLTPQEWLLVREHPLQGERLTNSLLRVDCIWVRNIVLYHHERLDGQGYPFRLKGEDIPLEARIVAIADAIDAMTTYRPYREGIKTWKEVTEELLFHAGTQFDPELVDRIVRFLSPHLLILSGEGSERSSPSFPSQ